MCVRMAEEVLGRGGVVQLGVVVVDEWMAMGDTIATGENMTTPLLPPQSCTAANCKPLYELLTKS